MKTPSKVTVKHIFILLYSIYLLLHLLGFFYFVETEILRLFECGKVRGTFSIVVPHKSLNGSLLTYYRYISRRECLINCMKHVKCHSTNFISRKLEDDFGLCELNSRNISGNISSLVERKNCLYAETPTNQTLVRYQKPIADEVAL